MGNGFICLLLNGLKIKTFPLIDKFLIELRFIINILGAIFSLLFFAKKPTLNPEKD